jgi:hypothetical protein
MTERTKTGKIKRRSTGRGDARFARFGAVSWTIALLSLTTVALAAAAVLTHRPF